MAINRTMRITISNTDKEKGREILKNTAEILKRNSLSGEVTLHTGCKKMRAYLEQDIYYYNIFILDAMDNSCIELAKMIRKRNCIASIVFYMDTKERVMDLISHRLSAVLLNDYSEAILENIIKYVYKEQQYFHPCFPIKNKDVMLRIPYEDILFFESSQKICMLHTQKQVIEFYAKMSEVEAVLPKEEFLRCHQSYLINMKAVIRLDKTNRCFELFMGHSIGISKAHYANSVTAYETFFEQF